MKISNLQVTFQPWRTSKLPVSKCKISLLLVVFSLCHCPNQLLLPKPVTLTFAVLKTSFLQSGRMLTDQAGKWYDVFRNITILSFLSSKFDRNAAQVPEDSVYTSAWNQNKPSERTFWQKQKSFAGKNRKCTSSEWPNVKFWCSPLISKFSESIIAWWRSLRCPHFGNLGNPDKWIET